MPAVANLVQTFPSAGNAFNFQQVVNNTTATVTWTIQNRGTATATSPGRNDLALISSNSAYSASGNCPALAPMAECSVTITFAPAVVPDLQPGQRVEFDGTMSVAGFASPTLPLLGIARPPFQAADP
jgi:hypothetical protein